jgi:hypothetical protein
MCGLRDAESGDPDKPPPEPPEIFDLFESQRYISKLIQWSLEASNRARSRPHLVDPDDDQEGGSDSFQICRRLARQRRVMHDIFRQRSPPAAIAPSFWR